MNHQSSGLQENVAPRPIYILPEDPFVLEILVPSFVASSRVDCMVGFFTSEVLVSLAPGLATFINQSHGTFRLVISPFLHADDWAAIETGLSNSEEAIYSLFDDILVTEDAIKRHTLECFSWLLQQGRMEIQIALLKEGLFHPKVWLFHDKYEEILCAHGSTNLTAAGMSRNVEQVAVCTSWGNDSDKYAIRRLDNQFLAFWSDATENCIVVPVPKAIRERLVQTYTTVGPPQELETTLLYESAQEKMTAADTHTAVRERISFHIPYGLRYEDGPFAHQGEAVDAWCNAGYRGVLEMATGAGKTITAMIAAYRLYQEKRPLLIVVAAPYIPLVQQWCGEIESFGISPVDLTSVGGSRGRGRELGRIRRSLRNGRQDVVAVAVSHDTLTTSEFHAELERIDATTLLIGDEVHGLGSEGFVSSPPEFVDYRLGLSATPIRQYDIEGTEALLGFFGPIAYQFTLEQAIGTCLVPYNYHVHSVELDDSEMNRWYDLSDRIRRNWWRDEDAPGLYVQQLLRDRRAILENAAGKIAALEEALEQENLSGLRHTLIYASDKVPDQLERVNHSLRELGVRYHQLTHMETSDRKKTQHILRSFQDGDLQVLTAKRVLDEGVNIPQIQKAFILASTTVERQWIQRRGRLLRKCDAIGKQYGEIHDFVAIPSDLAALDRDARNLVGSELTRIQEFARQAQNAGLPSGPLDTIRKLVQAAYL